MARNTDGSPSILSAEYENDPYTLHKVMREHFPLFWEDGMKAYVLSRYTDVSGAFKNPVFTNHNYDWQLEPAHGRSIVQMDGREHSTKRSLVAPSFRGKELFSKYLPLVESNSQVLLDRMIEKDNADYSDDYARLFPINVIASMLNLPNSDLGRFRAWYTAIINFLGNISGDPAVEAAGHLARDQMMEYMLPIIADRRENPAEDLLSALCLAEVDSVKMTDHEIKAFCSLLLTAGGETTDKALTSLLTKLIQHPEQMEALRADRTLITGALAETLRLAPPMQMALRETNAEVEIDGTTIPSGSTVVCLLAAANRDPERFEDPDTFDIRRLNPEADKEFTGATKQLAFVQGRHFCVGAQLARAEVEVGMNQLLDLTTEISMAPGFEPKEEGVFMRAPRKLPINFIRA